MNEKRILQVFLYIFLIKINCMSNEKAKSKKLIPYFRHQVEEIEDKKLPDVIENDDPHSNLVSFLVNNVKEIFNDVVEKPDIRVTEDIETITPSQTTNAIIKPSLTTKEATLLFRSTNTVTVTDASVASTSPISPTRTDVMLYENLTLTTLIDGTHTITGVYGVNKDKFYDINARHQLLSKDTKNVAKTAMKERDMLMLSLTSLIPIYDGNSSDSDADPRRSCIMCNNVASEDCNDPKNKLIQSMMCERDDDMCYSMHTPFGIIDRGCFNANHNITTYICSCNLCNYIPISEMPYTFGSKRDWIDNVIDISRTRHFRKSIFKDMSCLRCEVNTTQQKGDQNLIDSANCLEGIIANVPTEECEENEVCAVKALRADGYVWRGCIKAPLYNYWWTLCDFDLCNCDSIISIYDFF